MKTVNLSLSKELKEAGYPQNALTFWWTKDYKDSSYYVTNNATVESFTQEQKCGYISKKKS